VLRIIGYYRFAVHTAQHAGLTPRTANSFLGCIHTHSLGSGRRERRQAALAHFPGFIRCSPACSLHLCCRAQHLPCSLGVHHGKAGTSTFALMGRSGLCCYVSTCASFGRRHAF
jgi:hypothetical protein